MYSSTFKTRRNTMSLPQYSKNDEEAQRLLCEGAEDTSSDAPTYKSDNSSNAFQQAVIGERSQSRSEQGQRRTVMYIFTPTYMVEGEEELVISTFGETRQVSQSVERLHA